MTKNDIYIKIKKLGIGGLKEDSGEFKEFQGNSSRFQGAYE